MSSMIRADKTGKKDGAVEANSKYMQCTISSTRYEFYVCMNVLSIHEVTPTCTYSRECSFFCFNFTETNYYIFHACVVARDNSSRMTTILVKASVCMCCLLCGSMRNVTQSAPLTLRLLYARLWAKIMHRSRTRCLSSGLRGRTVGAVLAQLRLERNQRKQQDEKNFTFRTCVCTPVAPCACWRSCLRHSVFRALPNTNGLRPVPFMIIMICIFHIILLNVWNALHHVVSSSRVASTKAKNGICQQHERTGIRRPAISAQCIAEIRNYAWMLAWEWGTCALCLSQHLTA